MRSIYAGLPLAALCCLTFLASGTAAQQVTVSTPYNSVSEGFFENTGTSWGLSGRNWSFSFGGSPLQAAPQFGGFDPTAGANFGLGWRSGGVNGYFNGNWSQGCRRSMVSQVPSVTLQNGVPGFIADASQTPFVISYIPVVGGYAPVASFNPMQAMPPSTAASPGASGVGRDAVVNALRQHRAERDRRELIEDGPLAEAEAARMNRPAAANVQPRGAPDALTLIGSSPPPGEAAGNAADGPARKLAAARASSAGRAAPSVADARRLYAAEKAEQDGEAMVYVERGRNAEAKGKPNVAKVYYRMAANRASGQLREQVLAQLEALDASP